ncbi:MAG: pyridoxal phosphate-dependent aminotransferase [bacterium]|jgi:aspartate/methionine/tyrosine aminotransferase
MKFASRMSKLGTETAFVTLAKAKELEAQGKSIVHLEIGEPDFATPRNIIDKAHWALENGYTHYTPSAGLREMREKYAEYVSNRYGVQLSGKNVVIMPGAKPVVFLTALALVDEGDEVIYPNPGYPAYESVSTFLGAKSIPIILREKNEFRFDIDELKSLITPKTKLVFINSPQNPTGGMLAKEDIIAISELAEKHDFYILSDEIYSRIVYEGEHFSIMNTDNPLKRVILLDGHSKTYAMTGWRLGYAVCNEELAAKLERLMTNAASCTAAFTQIAGAEALHGDQTAVEDMVREFKERRDLIVDGLNAIEGVSCLMPKGAFYVFPNFSSFGRSGRDIADHLLYNAGVSCLAGTAFGEHGEGFLRFSYANSKENIKEALRRIAEAMPLLEKHSSAT